MIKGNPDQPDGNTQTGYRQATANQASPAENSSKEKYQQHNPGPAYQIIVTLAAGDGKITEYPETAAKCLFEPAIDEDDLLKGRTPSLAVKGGMLFLQFGAGFVPGMRPFFLDTGNLFLAIGTVDILVGADPQGENAQAKAGKQQQAQNRRLLFPEELIGEKEFYQKDDIEKSDKGQIILFQ